jgi:hypothetical protein
MLSKQPSPAVPLTCRIKPVARQALIREPLARQPAPSTVLVMIDK